MRIPGDPTELDWPSLWDEDTRRYRVQTRDGREVRIWTIDAQCNTEYTVRGETTDNAGKWRNHTWRRDGRWNGDDDSFMDLIPIPRRVKMYVNVYQCRHGEYCTGAPNESEKYARGHSYEVEGSYIATVPIEWEE